MSDHAKVALDGCEGTADRLTDLRYRKTKTKWGHCTREGVIQLNWQLMMTPEPVRHYLITHELCHLVHMNHSKRFWDLVERHCPNYFEAEQWLREHEHRFRF